jgi:hypothetical protein
MLGVSASPTDFSSAHGTHAACAITLSAALEHVSSREAFFIARLNGF